MNSYSHACIYVVTLVEASQIWTWRAWSQDKVGGSLHQWTSLSAAQTPCPTMHCKRRVKTASGDRTFPTGQSPQDNPHRTASSSTGHRPGWQQSWWSGMHSTPSWLQGRGRHYVSLSHNAPVEYKRPCSCYFYLSRGLLTHRYINKGRNWSRLFVRKRLELFLGGNWEQTLARWPLWIAYPPCRPLVFCSESSTKIQWNALVFGKVLLNQLLVFIRHRWDLSRI